MTLRVLLERRFVVTRQNTAGGARRLHKIVYCSNSLVAATAMPFVLLGSTKRTWNLAAVHVMTVIDRIVIPQHAAYTASIGV